MSIITKNKKNYILNHSQFFVVLDLLNLFISLYISSYVINNAVFGSTLFVCGYALQNYFLLRKHNYELKKKIFTSDFFGVIITLMLAFAGLFFYMYPSLTGNIGSLSVALVTALLFMRSFITLLFIQRYSDDRRQCGYLIAIASIAVSAVIFILLGIMVSWRFATDMGILSVIYPVAVLVWLYFSCKEELVFKPEYNIGDIASYNMYNAWLLCSNISLYLSIMTYVSILVLMPTQSDIYFPVALWLAIVFICTVVFGRILRRGALKNAEKSTLFLVGGLMWLFSFLQLNESFSLFNSSMAWFWSLIQAMGLALMMLLSTYMQEDMKLVLELTDDASDTAVKTNHILIQQAALLISGIFIYFELCFANIVFDGHISFFKNINDFRKSFMGILNLLPLVFVLLSMFFSLIQPVNRDIVRKLKIYREQKASNSINLAFEDRLKRLLIRRYRVRIGIKIIALLLKPLFYHKVINARYVDQSQGPSIFIANHREIYGPIVSNLYIPFSFRPWIYHEMLERNKISLHIWEGSFKYIKPAWLARLILKPVVPLVHWALCSVESIPVYRGNREVIKTIEMTIEALMEQDNILIFPENPLKTDNKKYSATGVSQLYTGFVHIAKAYYKRSGRIVNFYPIYANPQKRTLVFGEGISYDPEGKNEPERICGLLIDAMNKMA
jgi:hypothetical protein